MKWSHRNHRNHGKIYCHTDLTDLTDFICHTEITEITENTKRLFMDDKFNFIGRTLKTSFQDSSNKMKPLFSARIKQSS